MKTRYSLVALAIGLGLALALLWVMGGQTVSAVTASNALQSGADWEGLLVRAPVVVLEDGTYRMWYEGRGLTFYGWGFSMGYAESTDGLTWDKYAGNPVLGPGEPGAWDSAFRGQATVLKDGGLYKMYYSGSDGSGPMQTGYATSSDGLEWVVYAGNPVLQTGPTGSWDEMQAMGLAVIKDGTTYKMWYHGCNASYSVCSIGYATSPDGIAWTKHTGNPVLEGTPGEWDAPSVAYPRVIKNGDTYQVWYHSNGKIGLATSPDGINWAKYAGNPVLSEGWDGVGPNIASLLLDGDTYKMWVSSGMINLNHGIGYFESPDGIAWTQPVTNPILVKGEAGVIINVRANSDQVRAYTTANTPVTITVSDAGGIKATISGMTDRYGNYYSWWHGGEWDPEPPEILPGDTVSATTPSYSTIIETVGEIRPRAWPDTDLVEGTIHAPWFAPDALSVMCWIYDPYQPYLTQNVPADGGRFECDFSGLVDIVGGTGGQAGYIEPNGNMVSVEWVAPYMEVYYGGVHSPHDKIGAGGIYDPGHTFWITVTNSAGDIKATSTVSSTEHGGKWGHGFRPTWSGGDCCDWEPTEPNILPGDWVYFRSDEGYENQIQVGAIYGTVDLENDSITGPIYARWIAQTLEVWCHPNTMWPAVHRWSSATPNGSVPYFCEWQNPADGEPWDIEPDDHIMVNYREPGGDIVYRSMRAGDGAPPPPPSVIYLPLISREGQDTPLPNDTIYLPLLLRDSP